MTHNINILCIDDEKDYCDLLAKRLFKKGICFASAPDGQTGLDMIKKKKDINVVLLDIGLPDISGVDLVKDILKIRPNLPIIMVSVMNNVEAIVKSIKHGAFDYIQKPVDHEVLWVKLQNAFKSYCENQDLNKLTGDLAANFNLEQIIFRGKGMKTILEDVVKFADSNSSVFIYGESGTGKELIAKAIHYESQRKNGPFIAVNCSAIPDQLLENELFGHEKGAYTGAVTKSIGKFDVANGGTIFLDEIADMPINLQPKLLRVLQEKTFERVGGAQSIHLDVRVISATNKNITKAIQEGTFREDLFYRLNVLPITLPPLRERTEDIIPLAKHFLNHLALYSNKHFSDFNKEAKTFLLNYNWPGNIRELQNVIERAVVTGTPPVLKADDLPVDLKPIKQYETSDQNKIGTTLKEVEKKAIIETLENCNWNISKTARILGINRDTLYRKMRRHGINYKNS